MTVRLAVYIGKGGLFNRVIRWRTGSDASHVELVIDGLWYSSDIRDGGVRRKHIDPKPGEWRFLPLPWADAEAAVKWFDVNEEARYGAMDILNHFLGIGRDGKGEICSEACASALGFFAPWKYTPASLERACRARTVSWEASHGT